MGANNSFAVLTSRGRPRQAAPHRLRALRGGDVLHPLGGPDQPGLDRGDLAGG